MKRGKIWKLSLLFLFILAYLSLILTLKPEVIVESLIDPTTRLSTYHAMWSQEESVNKHDFYKPLLRFKTFERTTNAIRLIEIAQKGDHDSPLYLTLRDEHFSSTYLAPPWESWDNAKHISNWKDWFAKSDHAISRPPLEHPTSNPIETEYILSLHDCDGTLLDEADPRPFRGNNLTKKGETIYDINQDGWVERITAHHIGFSKPRIRGTLLTIRRINKETELLFFSID